VALELVCALRGGGPQQCAISGAATARRGRLQEELGVGPRDGAAGLLQRLLARRAATTAVPPKPAADGIVHVDVSKAPRKSPYGLPFLLVALIVALFAVAAALIGGGGNGGLSTLFVTSPLPKPTCEWSWSRLGCAASDASADYCRFHLTTNLKRVCVPRGVA